MKNETEFDYCEKCGVMILPSQAKRSLKNHPYSLCKLCEELEEEKPF